MKTRTWTIKPSRYVATRITGDNDLGEPITEARHFADLREANEWAHADGWVDEQFSIREDPSRPGMWLSEQLQEVR